MELTIWTYEGPPHVGAMRIATSMERVHYLLHAPQGDTYADLLFTMIERRDHRPPVTYTTFQARDLGRDTADLVTSTLRSTYERFQPDLMLVGESCTAELIQDQPGALAQGMNFPIPVVPLELPAYSKKENWGAAETFYHLTRAVLGGEPSRDRPAAEGRRPRANLLGPTALGFRCRDDVQEITRLLDAIGVDVQVIAPYGATPADIRRIPEADLNICLYPEIARTTCQWLERQFGQPTIHTVPIGIGATRDFVTEIAGHTGIDAASTLSREGARLPWYSRSVDSTYLTGKRVFIFGDGTHALAAARIARDEMGFNVVGLGTYSRELGREVRAAAKDYGVTPLITDDYLEVEAAVTQLQPELVLGTQMERHVAKRLGIPCTVISAPVHVQDFPARYSPQMGFEGANVIFDTWVHPLMMGLEEHLLGMFREDFEFHADAAPSHLGGTREPASSPSGEEAVGSEADTRSRDPEGDPAETQPRWDPQAEDELRKIPFFVRGKARRNAERYASERGMDLITLEVLYDAKAHFGR
jgi:light-independent protochlorophyllide reductase subunit B